MNSLKYLIAISALTPATALGLRATRSEIDRAMVDFAVTQAGLGRDPELHRLAEAVAKHDGQKVYFKPDHKVYFDEFNRADYTNLKKLYISMDTKNREKIKEYTGALLAFNGYVIPHMPDGRSKKILAERYETQLQQAKHAFNVTFLEDYGSALLSLGILVALIAGCAFISYLMRRG